MTSDGGTRARQQAQTRERLVSAAVEAFAELGYHKASVGEIARRAGYTKGAIYANFSNKEGLFLAAVDRRIQHQVDRNQEIEEAEAAGDPRLEELVEEFISEVFDFRWGLMAFEVFLYAMRESPDLRRKLAERYRAVDEHTVAHLERQSVASPRSRRAIALAQSALGEGILMRRMLDPEEVTSELINEVYGTVAAKMREVE